MYPTGVGCISHHSIEHIQNSSNPQWNGLYWIDQNGIYFSPDLGATTIRISDPIQPTFDGLSVSNLSTAVSGNRRDLEELWFSVRSSGGSTNDRVLAWNYKYGIWNPIYTGMAFRSFGEVSASGEFKLYAGEATADREVYDTTTGTTDDGTAISFKAKTKRFFLTNNYDQTKVLRKCWTVHDAISSQNLTVNMRKDFDGSDTESDTIDMTANFGEVGYNQALKAAQFEFVQEGSGVATAIHQVGIEFVPKDLD